MSRHRSDMEEHGRSLAAERTALAWHRTAIAAIVGELAVVKSSSSASLRAVMSVVMSAALLGLIIGCEVGSWHRGRAGGPIVRALPAGAFRAIAIIVAAVATGAFALALVPSS